MAVSIQSGSVATWGGTLNSIAPFGHDLAVAVAAGTNRVVVMTITGGDARAWTAKFNGVDMTLAGGQAIAANTASAVWYLVNPPVGTFNAFIGVSSWNGTTCEMSVAVFDGVDQTTPILTTAASSNPYQISPLSLALTSPSDGATIHAMGVYKAGSNPTFVLNAGQIPFAPMHSYQNNFWAQTSYKLGASTSVGATWATGQTQVSSYGVVLSAASGGGGGDVTAPTLTGSITVGTVTTTSIQITWPAGADNVEVTSYETKIGAGAWTDCGLVLTYTHTGLPAGTSQTIQVRAKDAAGIVSTPALSVTQSTAPVIVTGTLTTQVFKNWTPSTLVSITIPNVAILKASDRTLVLSLTNQAVNASGVMTITNAALVAGTKYLLATWENDTSAFGFAPIVAS